MEKKRNIFRYGFFGWENFKWFVKEIVKLYSSKPSYFSKKRFESSIAFIIGEFGMLLYLYKNYSTVSMTDFLLWAGVQFMIAGYYVAQTEKTKRMKIDKEKEETETEI